jgi:hypothetical protein
MFTFLSITSETVFSPVAADYIGRAAVVMIAVTFALRAVCGEMSRDKILSVLSYPFEGRRGRFPRFMVRLLHGNGARHTELAERRHPNPHRYLG